VFISPHILYHCIVIMSHQCILSSPQPESGPTQEPLRSKTDAGRTSFTASSAAAAFVRAQVVHYCPQFEEVPTLQMFIIIAIKILHCWFPVIHITYLCIGIVVPDIYFKYITVMCYSYKHWSYRMSSHLSRDVPSCNSCLSAA